MSFRSWLANAARNLDNWMSPISPVRPEYLAESKGIISPISFSSSTPSIPKPTPKPTPKPVQARNPSFSQYNLTPPVGQAITQAGQQYGGNNVDLLTQLLFDIAIQESSLNPSLVNTTQEGIQAGSPTGLFQFTDPTWQTVQRYGARPDTTLSLPSTNRQDPLTNALAAAYLISKGQLGRWDASKGVWGPFYSEEELEPFYAQTLR